MFLDCQLVTVCSVEIAAQRGWEGGAHRAGTARLSKNTVSHGYHLVYVVDQQPAVPREEEVSILAAPATAVRVEKACLLSTAAVGTAVVRASVAPLRPVYSLGIHLQRLEHVGIVALELPNSREAPPAVAFGVCWVASFACRAAT